MVSNIDTASATWHEIRTRALAEIEKLRGALEGDWDLATTTGLRGQIKALRIVLAMAGKTGSEGIDIGDPLQSYQPQD